MSSKYLSTLLSPIFPHYQTAYTCSKATQQVGKIYSMSAKIFSCTHLSFSAPWCNWTSLGASYLTHLCDYNITCVSVTLFTPEHPQISVFYG